MVTEAMVAERPDLRPYLGDELTVIAWLWARTVKSPNPAFSHVDIPLASTFILSSKVGKEAYVEPVVVEDSYYFTVKWVRHQSQPKAALRQGSAQLLSV
jgi:putative DNA methylase